MNEDDYMKEFRDKAAKVTKELNKINHGVGSSAIYNLNMHQDFIINKLGLQKKLNGHDLIIKILLYKILGLKTNEEEMKKQMNKMIKKPKSAMSVRFAKTHQNMQFSETRSTLQNYIRNHSRGQKKPGTHQGSRFSQSFFKGNMREARSHHTKGLIEQMNKYTNSDDMSSSRKQNKDLFTSENTIQEKLSPKSTINSIIDQ